MQQDNIKDKNNDNKKEKYKRKTTQVSVYFHDKELAYIDKICDKDMISRVTFVRRLLRDEMRRQGVEYAD